MIQTLISVITKICGLVWLLFHFLPVQSFAQEGQFQSFPIILRFEGIGGMYGIGAQYKKENAFQVAFATLKDSVDAEIVGVFNIPIAKTWKWGVGVANVNFLSQKITYTRGITKDSPVTQEAKAQAFGGRLDGEFSPKWTGFFTFAQTNFQFQRYRDSSGRKIEMPNLHLSDLESSTLIAGTHYEVIAPTQHSRSALKVGFQFTDFSTTTEFSGTQTFEYTLSSTLPITSQLDGVFHLLGADAGVSQPKTTDLQEINTLLEVDCTQIISDTKQQKCIQLKRQLAEYIQAHNRYGTARPLGGNSRLRSFREARFRGAHARFAGAELRWNWRNLFKTWKLQLAGFMEIGSVADHVSDLGETRTSQGVGIRVNPENFWIRLETATGAEGEAWYLTAGQPW